MMNKRIEFSLVLIVMLIFTTSQAAVISVPQVMPASRMPSMRPRMEM